MRCGAGTSVRRISGRSRAPRRSLERLRELGGLVARDRSAAHHQRVCRGVGYHREVAVRVVSRCTGTVRGMLSLLALASSACWGTSDFFAGLFSRRRPAVAVVGWTQSLAFVVLCVVVAVRWDHRHLDRVAAVVGRRRGLRRGRAALLLHGARHRHDRASSRRSRRWVWPCPSSSGSPPATSPPPWTWVGIVVAVVGVTLASGPELSGGVSPRPVVLAGDRGGRVRARAVLHRPGRALLDPDDPVGDACGCRSSCS